jgi:hypothetical protein
MRAKGLFAGAEPQAAECWPLKESPGPDYSTDTDFQCTQPFPTSIWTMTEYGASEPSKNAALILHLSSMPGEPPHHMTMILQVHTAD